MNLQTVLDNQFLRNSVELWLTAAAVFAGLLGGLTLVRRVVVKRLDALAKSTATDVDNLVVDLLGRTRFFFILAVALLSAMTVLETPPIGDAVQKVILWAAIFVQAVIWSNGVISWWIGRFTTRHAQDGQGNAAIIQAMGGAIRVAAAMAIFILCLDRVMEITPLIAGLGIGGIAIALAVQNILGDLFSAVSILVDKPFRVGDFVVVGDDKGTVEHIGLKSTRVRSLGGEQIIFSNADLLKSRVRNYKRMQERRVAFQIGVVYQTPFETLQRIPTIIREIVEAQQSVRFERCHFFRYADSWLEYETIFWVLSPDYMVYADIQQSVNLEMFRQFEAEGISFAYPTRTIWVEKEREVVGGDTAPLKERADPATVHRN
jgi:small-conductance mechanosensitive channel